LLRFNVEQRYVHRAAVVSYSREIAHIVAGRLRRVTSISLEESCDYQRKKCELGSTCLRRCRVGGPDRPRVKRLASLGNTGSPKAPTVKAAIVAKADPAEAVKQAFTQTLIVDRQLGVPSSQEQLRLRPVPAGRTDLKAADVKMFPASRTEN